MLARRTRLAFLNVRAAQESLPRVIELMSRELGWSQQREQVWTEGCARGYNDDNDDDDDDARTMFVSLMWGQNYSKRLYVLCSKCRTAPKNGTAVQK